MAIEMKGRPSIREVMEVLELHAYDGFGRPLGEDTPYFEEAMRLISGIFTSVELYDSKENNVVVGVLVVAGKADEVERRVEGFKKMIENRTKHGREKEPIVLKNGHTFLPYLYDVDDLVEFIECTGLRVMPSDDIECKF